MRLEAHDIESMRRSLAIGGELTCSDLEQLVEDCGELLAQRVRMQRALMQLRSAAGRAGGAVDELYRAFDSMAPSPDWPREDGR